MDSHSNSPTLSDLYDRYMALVEAQFAADCEARAAINALEATSEYITANRLTLVAGDARAATEAALAEVKAAVAEAFTSAGDRQPHPYAGIARVDRRPVYDPRLALRWVRERPDYHHLIVPETVDRKGFEKLARALDGAGLPPILDNGDYAEPVVEWDEIPVVSVKLRPDE